VTMLEFSLSELLNVFLLYESNICSYKILSQITDMTDYTQRAKMHKGSITSSYFSWRY